MADLRLRPEALEAVILAGGLGTRLRPLVADRPKALAPVAGRPFLGYVLDQLEWAGLQKAILCTGYLGEHVQQAFGAAQGALALDYVLETEPLGTAGAVRGALPRLAGEWCLVLNGDSYCDVDLVEFIRWTSAHSFVATLLLNWVEDSARFGTAEVDEQGAIRQFREKTGQVVPGWINAGVYLLSRRLMEALPTGQPVSLERQCFPEWISLGLGGYGVRAAFIDIGTPDAFALAQDFFVRNNLAY
jgi:NDP-sugar pyrophosphorylase family protein